VTASGTTAELALPAVADRGDSHRYIIAAAVVLASMLQVIDSSIVNVAIPHMMGTLGATVDEIAWVSTGYILASVVIIPMTGWLAAFFGRKRYFAASILVFTAASFFCGAAGSLTSLVVWRVIQGIGGGALLSTSQAIIYEAFPRREAAKAMAFWGVGVMVGPTLGPTLGGWITDNYSWPWIFYINLPIGLLSAFMVIAFVHDRPNQARSRTIDTLGILLLTVSVICLQYVLEHGEREDWFDSRLIVGLTVAGVLTGLLLVWRELTIKDPVVDFRVLRHSQMSVGVIMAVIIGVGLYGSMFILPVFLQGMLHMTAFQTGMLVLPGAIATALAMFVLGRVGDRLDPRLVIFVGSLLFAWGMWEFSHVTLQSGTDDFFWPLILRGLGLGLVFVPLSNIALADLALDELPQGTGLYNFFRQLGGSFGIAAMASLLSRYTSQADQAIRANIVATSPVTLARVGALARGLAANGIDPGTARREAIAMIAQQVNAQASVIGFGRIYLLSGLMLVASLPLLLFVRHVAAPSQAGAVHAE
jgi:DHA2 family multidrug resistance protein